MTTGDSRADLETEEKPSENLRFLVFLIGESIKIAFYFISFLPMFLMWNYLHPAHSPTLFLVLIAGFYIAATLFIALVVLAKRTLIGNLETNQVVTIESSLARRFFFASMLHAIMLRSPFKALISGLSPMARFYYRGMGSNMASSVFISGSARISDPWFLEIQENATIGGDALVLGHAGNGRDVILGSVFIGEGAVIGARALLLPDVRIGRYARVGAGAVVIRGTSIPDGETWAGVPARRIISRRDKAV